MANLFDEYNNSQTPSEPDFEASEDLQKQAAGSDDQSGSSLSAEDDILPPFKARTFEEDYEDYLEAPFRGLAVSDPADATAKQDPESAAEAASARHVYKVSPAEADLSSYMLPPPDEPVPEESSGWSTAWAIIREVGETIILTLIIFFLIQTVVRNFRVVGTSMLDNLQDGQYLIIDKLTYSYLFTDLLDIGGPQRGDVIVFQPPNRPDDDYVKRIIGLPGETVEIINGRVYINSQLLEEPFQPTAGTYSSPPQVVPENQVYVLGDNRNNSNDSHTWGSLPVENIVGRAWISYWPPELWGVIPRDIPTEEGTIKHFVTELLTPSANADSQ